MSYARDPVSKCVIKLPDGVYRGSKIIIQGRIPPDAQRFSINLQRGASNSHEYTDDLAFHLNPRFTQMLVIRNHLWDRKWGKEESSGGMPLSRDSTFEAVIECEESAFMVSFNGKHFCEFAHRVQYTQITHLMVDGDINIRNVSL